MKKLIQLGMLSALVCVSAQATTVTWSTPTSSTNSITGTGSGSDSIAATGYVLFNGNYSQFSVQSDPNGVGVDSSNGGVLTQGQNSSTVDGQYAEYVVFNFSNTLTGNVAVSSIVMNFTGSATSPYFRYAWSATAPTTQISDNSFTQVTSTSTNSTSNPYTFSALAGSGRYLVINPISPNSLQVSSITYASVPDGASTLALMGAALATLGFAGRRRKA